MQIEATKYHTWENTLCQFSGISKTQDLGEYVGCMSLYLDFGFDALECCHSECRVSCINSLFSTVWQARRRLFDSSHAIQVNYFLFYFTCDLTRSSSGAFSVVVVCVLSAQQWPLAAFQTAREASQAQQFEMMLKFLRIFSVFWILLISPQADSSRVLTV